MKPTFFFRDTVKVKFDDDDKNKEREVEVPFSDSISSGDDQDRPDTPSDISGKTNDNSFTLSFIIC